jgi:hypothetical protein
MCVARQSFPGHHFARILRKMVPIARRVTTTTVFGDRVAAASSTRQHQTNRLPARFATGFCTKYIVISEAIDVATTM